MDELVAKKEQAAKLWREIRDEEDRRKLVEEYPEKKKLEGYWKYHNASSGFRERWWIYGRVSNVTPDGHMDILKLQIDYEGRLTVEDHKRWPWEMLTEGWIRSNEGEYHEGWLQAKAVLDKAKVQT